MITANHLAEIVGQENLATDDVTLSKFSKDLSFTPAVRPKFVIWPQNSDEIQRLIHLARETHTPIVPMSSGEPHFKGDTVPSTGGSIILNLSRMKKIIHVSRKHRSVMFEPGVTFEELIPSVTKNGLRLNPPLIPRKTKSVLGSVLEREPVIMPKYHWDLADPLGCTEIIFGSGDLTRTGAAAGSGSIEAQWAAGGGQKEAAGPSSASWYRVIQAAQGTMGVVTWASARCEIIPTVESPYFISGQELNPLLDCVHWLIRLRLVNECLILNRAHLAIIAGSDQDRRDRLRQELPPWILFFNIAGYEYYPEERVQGQTEDMLNIAQKLSLTPTKTLNGLRALDLLKMLNQPSDEPYWKIREKGGCQDIFFLTLKDRLKRLTDVMMDEATATGVSASDIPVYIQPLVQGVNYHCEFGLPFNPDRSEEVRQIKSLHPKAVKRLMANGAFFSRPYAEITPLIMNRDAASVEALKKVKKLTDPEHIMNPGKLCF